MDHATLHGDIEKAIGQRLAAMTDCPPINWPNRDLDSARPILIFTHNVTARGEAGLNGGGLSQEGFVEIAVMVNAGDYTTDANSWAGAIMARFPKALRLPLANGGHVVIVSARVMGAGYRDGADFRLPVRINYKTG